MTDKTILYYNNNAAEYVSSTEGADLSELRSRFLKYVRRDGTIADLGAGSGRDMLCFAGLGYEVCGIDASAEICKILALKGLDVSCTRIEDWRPAGKYSGIWACASLLHLEADKVKEFIARVHEYLEPGGAFYFSVKTGVETGYDGKGRFFQNFTEEDIDGLAGINPELELADRWNTADELGREGTEWINVIMTRRESR